ncbi:MAG TPA: hypothetical protein VGC62_15390 [Pseudomonas sp.]|uniref:vWA domain-containing protein n=1 Tax=Pseudomonas sp. TaxID=306 RepID=UPI002ED9365D
MQRVIRDASTPPGEMTTLDAKVEIIRKHFPPNIASLYAIPREGSGGVLEWWTDLGGQATPFSTLSEDQQRQLLDTYHRRQQSLEQLADELQNRGQPDAASELRSLIGEPEPEQLYSLNGEPLVVRWQSLKPKPKPVPPIAPAAAAVAPAVVRRRLWPWLLLALLLLLLAFLLWWFWRTPEAQPVPVVPEPVPQVIAPPAPKPEPIPEPAPVPVPEPEPEPEPIPEPAPPPPPPVPEPAPKPVPKPKPEKVCPKPLDAALPPQFVVVLDTSGSMNLNVKTSPRDDEWYATVGANLDPRDPRVAPMLVSPTRLEVAKDSLAKMINNLQPEIDTRFMAFQGCGKVVDYGVFPTPKRTQLIKGIYGLRADYGTPLAESLAQAASRVDGRNRDAFIVMYIDGEDNCQQDACAVSRRIAQNQPRLKVNVVNIGENSLSNCMAENTGGRVYVSRDAVKLKEMLQQASKEVSKTPGCP